MEFTGVVTAGEGRGRTIGFPTANLRVAATVGLPLGVFAGWASWDGQKQYTAVVNIGRRPTFADEGCVTVEVHVLEFDGDLYDKSIRVRLEMRLRDEQRFDSVGELTQQIARDIARARVMQGAGTEK